MFSMGKTYLVEIRLARTRWRIKELSRAITQQFGVGHYRERHPHVTLFGPFTLGEFVCEQDLLDTIATCAAPYGAIPFTIGEWERRDGVHGGIVAFSILPSPDFVELATGLSRALTRITTSLNPWDQDPGLKWYHATIANHLPPGKAGAIMAGLPAGTQLASDDLSPPHPFFSPMRAFFAALSGPIRHFLNLEAVPIRPVLLDDAGIRITVMRENEILGEYDLMQQRWLAPEEIPDDRSWQESMARYRVSAGFERSGQFPHPPGKVFLISDLHLGHANIIRYCSRPFVPSDVDEMDRVLVANWNYTISPGDRVYFLGDLRYGKGARTEKEYKSLLNGTVTYIGGNHDRDTGETVSSARIACNGMDFLLVHDPAEAPSGYTGWVIHGHHHNNDLRAFPYIDPERKQINVSAEVVGYFPVSLQEICRTLKETVLPSGKSLLLRYPYTAISRDGTDGRNVQRDE
jgi:calcineurin-like phosphoesterase family protein